MINGQRILCIVPARAGSKGLPDKNIRLLEGKPLLTWPIAAALGSSHVDRVIISTDSQEYADLALAAGADAPFLRPFELASDHSPSIDFILHAIDKLAESGDYYDWLLLLEPTSPLTETADVDAAIAMLAAADGLADSVVGVTAMESQHPAYSVTRDADGRIAPLQGQRFADMPRRQDLSPVFNLDGSLYLSTVAALRRERSFCHNRTLGYVTSREKALEVDSLTDFICIEALLAYRNQVRPSKTVKN
jgi:N-acylneuraminate cytidylyltransferase/CMP-N,N'-diacetyllegionaminic acid synthase